jgi:soluble lytic murein transglycosylase-like protein
MFVAESVNARRAYSRLRLTEVKGMSITRRMFSTTRHVCAECARSAGVFLRDVVSGTIAVSHNALAVLGLIAVALVVFLAGRADLRQSLELDALSWLQARHETPADALEAIADELKEPDAVARATASDPKDLNRMQSSVAQWLSKRYRVAPEPISRLVVEAWDVGAKTGLDPTLILAIMAVESSFNPFAQSPVGAQGLMQVMTRVHDAKYEAFGGAMAAFDPVTNLRVGVLVLKECIARAGSVAEGLRLYVGAGNLASDDGYVSRVQAEQSHLRAVASGRVVAFNASNGAVPRSIPATQVDEKPSAQPEPDKGADDGASADQVATLR